MTKETEAERAAIAKFLREKGATKVPAGEAFAASGKMSSSERIAREYIAAGIGAPAKHVKRSSPSRALHQAYYIEKKMNNEVDNGE